MVTTVNIWKCKMLQNVFLWLRKSSQFTVQNVYNLRKNEKTQVNYFHLFTPSSNTTDWYITLILFDSILLYIYYIDKSKAYELFLMNKNIYCAYICLNAEIQLLYEKHFPSFIQSKEQNHRNETLFFLPMICYQLKMFLRFWTTWIDNYILYTY